MEDAYIITGGNPLKGHVQISGAKNIALKVIIAALLFSEEKVVINNIPHINDVEELIHLINSLGAKAHFASENTLHISRQGLKSRKVNLLHASKIRTSFMLFAPLLKHFGEAYIPNPGGCRLGARSIDRIVDGMSALGIQVSYDSDTGYYHAVMEKKPTGRYRFEKPTHTGTELLIMLGSLTQDEVIIENGALEPEIDDLIAFLNEGGARIERIDSTIIIKQSEELTQEKPFTIAPDRVEAATFATLAIASKGDITISSIPEHYIKAFIDRIQKAGAGVEKVEDGWRFFYRSPLQKIEIETSPYPGFLTDWQPLLAVLATQAQGDSLIHERIFENRFSYVSQLHKLGAHISFIQPNVEDPQHFYHFPYDSEKTYHQAICINGPQLLHGGVVEVADLRAGATLAIAALIAKGESYVRGVSHLERGYEKFVEKIQVLGGNIKKI